MANKNEGTIAMLVVGGLLLIGALVYRNVSEAKRMERETKIERAEMRINEIRSRMKDMPAGGDLELLSADLRKAEAELERAKD